jgi:hypothetical protein
MDVHGTFTRKRMNIYGKTTGRLIFHLKQDIVKTPWLKYYQRGRQVCSLWLLALTLSPPAVKTQCLSQCQAFQRLVRSSHTLVNWILNNFRSTESIFNHFSVFLKILNALCVCLQYKHPRSMKRVIRSDKPITSVFPVKSQNCSKLCERDMRARNQMQSTNKNGKQTTICICRFFSPVLKQYSCILRTYAKLLQ